MQTFVTALLRQGEIIGYTEIRAAAVLGSVASTQDTAVLPGHRRAGHGTLLKRASLAALSDERPDIRLVTATNESGNEPMLRINRAAGFEPVATYTQMVLTFR